MYLDANQLPDDGTDYIDMIRKAGHLECLEAFYRICLERKDPKKNLLWLYGAPNSGKSTFINHLASIFCCQEFNFQEKYCTTQKCNRDD